MKQKILRSYCLLLALIPAGGGVLAGVPEEDPEAQFAAALSRLRQVIEEPGSCLPDASKCEKLKTRLQGKMARAAGAGSDALKMKLVAGVLKNSKAFSDSIFASEWLERFFPAADAVVLAGQAIVEGDIDALEEKIDVYGSPLDRFKRQGAAIARKKQLADDGRGDGSLRAAAIYLGKIGAVHQAAEKLLISIER